MANPQNRTLLLSARGANRKTMIKSHAMGVDALTLMPASPLVTLATMNKAFTPAWNREAESEPNPPQWPDDGSVMVVRPSVEGDETAVERRLVEFAQDPWDEANHTFTSDLHFSSRRRAVLFAPGTYRCRFQVGYYTQVLGLGQSTDDVRFVPSKDATSSLPSSFAGPYVPALNKNMPNPHGTSLDTFWRSAENFTVVGDLQWAVSQASPLRKVRVAGDLILHDGAAYASGGHVAESVVHGRVHLGGQQQFLFRNVHLEGGTVGGAWSVVCVGCTGRVPPESQGHERAPSVTVVEGPQVRMEKPYICLQDDAVHYELRVPRATYGDATVGGSDGDERVIDFAHVRVVHPQEPVETIQHALDEGKHVVLCPGIYALAASIHIRTAGQVVLGLGLATLTAPLTGEPCIQVSPSVLGVVVAGIMLEASPRFDHDNANQVRPIVSLFEWGSPGMYDPGAKDSPGGLMDIFCRVGGTLQSCKRSDVALDVMVRIHSGRVVGDNLWLWRADHAELAPGEQPNYLTVSSKYWQTEEHEYRVETGFVVLGDDVTIYGLAVEHASGHQTIWAGERGVVYFYQCEFPYGADHSFAHKEFRGYLVDPSVVEHELYAPGIYSNFRNHPVLVATAVEHPPKELIRVKNPFTVKLDNQGGILSVVNGLGETADVQGRPTRL